MPVVIATNVEKNIEKQNWAIPLHRIFWYVISVFCWQQYKFSKFPSIYVHQTVILRHSQTFFVVFL